MSRSRKQPYYTDYSRKYTRWAKRQASRKVRHTRTDIPDGMYFKKLYCSWNIHDWVWYSPDSPKAYRK